MYNRTMEEDEKKTPRAYKIPLEHICMARTYGSHIHDIFTVDDGYIAICKYCLMKTKLDK